MSSYERDDSVTEDVREGADDLGDAAKRDAKKVKEGAKSVQTASRTPSKSNSRRQRQRRPVSAAQ